MTTSSCSLKHEAERLETFGTWPVSFMDPGTMAKDGFYYTQQEDVVKCAFCGISLYRWREGDSVAVEHRLKSPQCPFLSKLPVGNVPLGGPSSKEERPFFSKDCCGYSSMHAPPLSCREQALDGTQLGELSMRTLGTLYVPAFPKYSTYEARLASFKDWPSSSKQRPQSLSEAGFYYNGKDDETVCFHCGGPLKHWEDDDLPWAQHALWYPTCTYVYRMKGDTFVREVCDKAAALLKAK